MPAHGEVAGLLALMLLTDARRPRATPWSARATPPARRRGATRSSPRSTPSTPTPATPTGRRSSRSTTSWCASTPRRSRLNRASRSPSSTARGRQYRRDGVPHPPPRPAGRPAGGGHRGRGHPSNGSVEPNPADRQDRQAVVTPRLVGSTPAPRSARPHRAWLSGIRSSAARLDVRASSCSRFAKSDRLAADSPILHSHGSEESGGWCAAVPVL
jgi:hypothetical protein